MIVSQATARHASAADGAAASGDAMSAAPRGSEPVGRLRGAGVQVDAARVGTIAAIVALVTVAVVAVVLLVAGAQKNAQVTALEHQGVPVRATVVTCQGLLGGSGSNAAGYACTARYTVGGHVHLEGIPGNALLAPGSVVRGIVAVDDPALFTTPGVLAGERPSATVFLAPAIMLACCALFGGVLVARARRRRARRRRAR